MTPSWSRTQAIELRNRAAERAQVCAPIVQEAEELDALIDLLDEVLGGAPTPHADALRARVPVSDEDYPDPNATTNATTQNRVLTYVASRDGEIVRPAEVALALGISAGVARVMLSRLVVARAIERPSHGCYRASQR